MKRILMTIAVLMSLVVVPLMTARAAADCAARHTVLPGENLFRIGLKYGLQWPVIASANGIGDPRTLKAGQVLCIPTVLPTPLASPVAATPVATRTPTTTPGTGGGQGATATPAPTIAPAVKVPRITIAGVVRDQTVTITAVDFPPNQDFEVLMGPIGTKGIGGIKAATQNSGTGVFTATYPLPAALRDARQIAIRLESTSGFFSYNWFYNQPAAVSP